MDRMEKIKGRGSWKMGKSSRSVVSSNECERTRAKEKEAFLARARLERTSRVSERSLKKMARALCGLPPWKIENENAGIPQLGSKMRGKPAFSGPRDINIQVLREALCKGIITQPAEGLPLPHCVRLYDSNGIYQWTCW